MIPTSTCPVTGAKDKRQLNVYNWLRSNVDSNGIVVTSATAIMQNLNLSRYKMVTYLENLANFKLIRYQKYYYGKCLVIQVIPFKDDEITFDSITAVVERVITTLIPPKPSTDNTIEA